MTHEERFDRIDANIGRLNDTFRESIRQLTQFVLDFRQETIQHLEVIDGRLDVLTATITSIDSRFPPLTKALLDFGKISTHLTNDQARN
jgi:hypothetical protein